MKSGSEQFKRLVDEAYDGRLQLPAFQRPWRWTSQQVISLFDSVRKEYPIGSFLFLQSRPDFNLSPRPFSSSPSPPDKAPERYVLDGQQRINSGIAIYHGTLDGPKYYLNLAQLWQAHLDTNLDLSNPDRVLEFANDLDDGDAYCVARRISAAPQQLLLNNDLLWTPFLANERHFQTAVDLYLERHPDRKAFIDSLIRPHFKLSAALNVTTTTLDNNETIEATTRIFATLNTTGKPLTPFEIVVAHLYSADIFVPKDVDEYKEITSYYKNMDPTGELFLQTIAMLAGETPRKSKLPKTITPERYTQYADLAVELLERVGKLLTDRLGVGLDVTSTLVPYDTIFPPMAVCLHAVQQAGATGTTLTNAYNKLETWFVLAALSGRYQEGVNTKQDSDLRDIRQWILVSQADKPTWMTNFQIPTLLNASPSGAIGRLLACLMNRQSPKDPMDKTQVGYRPNASGATQRHHVFPKMFCQHHIPNWPQPEEPDQALNIIFTESTTNTRWTKLDPADQLQDIQQAFPHSHVREQMLADHCLDSSCVAILAKRNKTFDDYRDFLRAREQTFLKKLAEWGIQPTKAPAVDSDVL